LVNHTNGSLPIVHLATIGCSFVHILLGVTVSGLGNAFVFCISSNIALNRNAFICFSVCILLIVAKSAAFSAFTVCQFNLFNSFAVFLANQLLWNTFLATNQANIEGSISAGAAIIQSVSVTASLPNLP